MGQASAEFDPVAHYLAEFTRFERERPSDPAWLQAIRRRAAEVFRAGGFPTTRLEPWRFTSIAPLLQATFALARVVPPSVEADALAPYALESDAAARLVFLDGWFVPALSDAGDPGSGLRVSTLADALSARPEVLSAHLAQVAGPDHHAFRALNAAFLADGAVIEVDPGTIVERPVQVLWVASGQHTATMAHPRTLIVAGSACQLRVIETYATLGRHRSFTNAVTEVVLDDGAVVEHYRLQQESDRSVHMGTLAVLVTRAASFTSQVLSCGAALSRGEITVRLAGEGASCVLNGLSVVDGQRVVDHQTEIDHAEPQGTSVQLYKGILGGRARGVFNGRIRVRPGAQKTDARQTSKTLLLSDEAQINTTPQLEILANDVRCTHGATVGQISRDQLFYLRARGIGEQEARRMLIRAFAADVLDRMPLGAVRAMLDSVLASQLDRVNEGAEEA